jgi:hypothetical protein
VRRAVGRLALVAGGVLAALAAGTPAFACPSCFSQAEGPLVDAARLGMGLLLAVVVALQVAFVLFFLHLRRQAAKAADRALDEEWSHLQREWGRKGALGP